jgi:hypothetical protein
MGPRGRRGVFIVMPWDPETGLSTGVFLLGNNFFEGKDFILTGSRPGNLLPIFSPFQTPMPPWKN